MTKFIHWFPKHDGHEPPHWESGMHWDTGSKYTEAVVHAGQTGEDPDWYEVLVYCVPWEAVHGSPLPFDLEEWLDMGRANADKLPAGVTLPPKKTWADVAVEYMGNLRGRSYTDGQQDDKDIRKYLLDNFQPREPREPKNG